MCKLENAVLKVGDLFLSQVPHLCRPDGTAGGGNDFGSGIVLGTRIPGSGGGGKANSKTDRFHVVHLAPTPDGNDDEDAAPGWNKLNSPRECTRLHPIIQQI